MFLCIGQIKNIKLHIVTEIKEGDVAHFVHPCHSHAPRTDGHLGEVAQFIGDIEDGLLLLKSFTRIQRLNLHFLETALNQRKKFSEKLGTASCADRSTK